MSPLTGITGFISWIISIYMFICIIRIIITWFPTFQNSKFAGYLKIICDPYLNLFRKINFLHIGNLDFTPALAIGLLAVASNILTSIAANGALRLGATLGSLIQLLWSIASSVITFFNIIIALRLIMNILHKDYNSGIWSQLDRIIYPVQHFIISKFKGKTFSYKAQLGITLLICILVQIIGSWLIGLLITLLTKLPF
ncbi:MAG: YggT family protein [Treponemataceae bacterium]|nr:YggT family protein [Treponemataceae bacterium]